MRIPFFFLLLLPWTAIFFIRESNFLGSIPDLHKKDFVDVNPVAPEKMTMLKQMLRERFGVS